ncbi:hypothetical protein D3C75_631900 [compost metagenome]
MWVECTVDFTVVTFPRRFPIQSSRISKRIAHGCRIDATHVPSERISLNVHACIRICNLAAHNELFEHALQKNFVSLCVCITKDVLRLRERQFNVIVLLGSFVQTFFDSQQQIVQNLRQIDSFPRSGDISGGNHNPVHFQRNPRRYIVVDLNHQLVVSTTQPQGADRRINRRHEWSD